MSPEARRTVIAAARRVIFAGLILLIAWLALLLLTWVMAGDALLERLGFRSKAVWAKAME